MKFNHEYDAVISADDRGIIEYWNPATLQFPENGQVLSGDLFNVFLLTVKNEEHEHMYIENRIVPKLFGLIYC